MNFFGIGPCYWSVNAAKTQRNGQVAEWSKAHAWKVCRRETVSRVRIPVCPPSPHGYLRADGLRLNTPELTGGYKLRVRVRYFP